MLRNIYSNGKGFIYKFSDSLIEKDKIINICNSISHKYINYVADELKININNTKVESSVFYSYSDDNPSDIFIYCNNGIQLYNFFQNKTYDVSPDVKITITNDKKQILYFINNKVIF